MGILNHPRGPKDARSIYFLTTMVAIMVPTFFARDLGIYAYDAYFLVCGNIAKAPLVSLDRALVSKAKEYGLRILEV